MMQENPSKAKVTCMLDPMWHDKYRLQRRRDGETTGEDRYLGAEKYIFNNVFAMEYLLLPINLR
jgi:hypothetical protein